MRRFLNILLLCLTVFAVGAAQIVGAQASYFCESTGQKTLLETCDSSCHLEADGHHECSGIPDSEETWPGKPLPGEPEQEHVKVLEQVLGTPTPTLLQSPAVLWIAVLTDPSPALAFSTFGNPWPAVFETQPPERAIPQGSTGIARTTVMLV